MNRKPTLSRNLIYELIKKVNEFSFRLRNALLVKVYHYFRAHNLPIQDLADMAEMSRQALYQTVSNYTKAEKGGAK